MTNDVCVLMCVYEGDQEPWVSEAIESLLKQSHPVDVYVYVDGPVRASLAALLDSTAARHESVRVIPHPTNRGLAFGLNHLIEVTRGKYRYYARMDADDVSLPHRIERQVAYLDAHPEIDVLGGAIMDMDERGVDLKVATYPSGHDDIRRFFAKRNPMAHVTVVFRESYFEKAGLYPPNRLEDGLYWMAGLRGGARFENLAEPLVRVRRTDDFLRRRSGVRKQWAEYRIKIHINRELRLGAMSYLYATAMLGVQLAPVWVKRILYNTLR